MVDIRPFHGVHYNRKLIKDLSRVLCPPYDVITPGMQQELYRRSDYNFVRVEYGRELTHDNETDNKYTRALATLESWLRDNVLTIDNEPAIYIHDHNFTYLNKQYRRRSLICLVRLEEWDTDIIRPHEGTILKDKSDRLQILWTLNANTSPILSLYEDSHQHLPSLLESETRSKPFLKCSGADNESHYLWAITDAGIIERIRGVFTGKPLYIADGHHRYESALTYRHERRLLVKPASASGGEEPFDFIMMMLVDLSDSGLLILPSHRLLRGIPKSMTDNLLSGLRTFFDVSEVPLDKKDVRKQVENLLFEEDDEVKLLLYGLTEEHLLVLSLKNFERVRTITPYFHSDLYHKLNVSVVDHVILEKLLGITYDKAHEYLDYCSDSVEAINSIGNEYRMAILLNPVKPDTLKTIADSGDRMPRKSTYFYPKIPTGLVFYRLGN